MEPAAKDQLQAGHTWTAAKQARATVNKRLTELETCPADAAEGVFQAVEESMAHFRLQCMGTLFLNIELAQQKDVEDSLWQTQTKINQSYRKALSQLRKSPKTNVVKNKVEKRYLSYLKISQQFYKGLIQRLASRYIIPEIEDVCHSFGLQTLQEKERVDAVAANIDGNIFKSCYNTLIRLGDLSRYRYQQTQKGIDSGITYYSLAQKLNPDDGTAHHQMGVLYNEQGRHLEITYHFYRAALCKKPHPNAIKNLQIEFKRVLDPGFFKHRGNNNSPREVLRSWFIRLHANFNKGQTFPEYDELEDEVVHRLGMAWKSNETPHALLQMLQVNFATYHESRKNVTGEWTMMKSQSCQFALRLIVRTTLSLSSAIHMEIMNLADDRSRLSPAGARPSNVTFTSVLSKLLPLFRVSCAWLVYHHRDIVQYEEHLQPYIGDMYRMVARAQTSFANAFSESCPDPSNIATYLLPEDQETAGFLAMDNEDVFYALRFHFDKNGKRKPRPTGDTEVISTEENWWRVRDILNCGLFLVGDPKFPLELVDVKGVSEMIYTEDAPIMSAEPSPTIEKTGAFDKALDLLRQKSQSQPQTPEPEVEPVVSPRQESDFQMPPRVITPPNISKSSSMPRAALSSAVPIGAHPQARIPSHHNSVSMVGQYKQSPPIPEPAKEPTLLTEETDESLENQMVNMVDDLVDTVVADDQQPQSSRDTSSYGVGDTTTELLSKLKSPDKVFPSLPWNYFLNSPSNKPFGSQGSQFPQTPQQTKPADVYQQIYGGSAAFSSSASIKAPDAPAPGWTSTQVKAMDAVPQWDKSPSHVHSPSVSGMSTQSPNNIWGPNTATPSKPANHTHAQSAGQQQGSQWGPPCSAKSPSTGGLVVPGAGPKPAPHMRKTSQGDYDVLYQRLASMASAAKEPKNSGVGQKSPVTAAGTSNLMYAGAFGQTQPQQSGMSPGMSPSSFGKNNTGLLPPPNGSALKSNPWPQYGPQSYNTLSPTNPGFSTIAAVPATSVAPAIPPYLSAGTAGMNMNINMAVPSSFPAPGNSSIWASTPGNGRAYDPTAYPYGRGGAVTGSPNMMMAPMAGSRDDPTSYKNKVRANTFLSRPGTKIANEYDRQVLATAWSRYHATDDNNNGSNATDGETKYNMGDK